MTRDRQNGPRRIDELGRRLLCRHRCRSNVGGYFGRFSNCFRARSRSLDRTCRLAATSASTAGKARDDDVEDGDDSVDDGLEDGTDSVDDGHQGSADGLEHRLDLWWN